SHELLSSVQPRVQAPPSIPNNRQGAYQSYEQGRDASVSCACHWTVNKAASAELGRLWGECYTLPPCGIFVPATLTIRAPEELAQCRRPSWLAVRQFFRVRSRLLPSAAISL